MNTCCISKVCQTEALFRIGAAANDSALFTIGDNFTIGGKIGIQAGSEVNISPGLQCYAFKKPADHTTTRGNFRLRGGVIDAALQYQASTTLNLRILDKPIHHQISTHLNGHRAFHISTDVNIPVVMEGLRGAFQILQCQKPIHHQSLIFQ